jgi:hypothetical protein
MSEAAVLEGTAAVALAAVADALSLTNLATTLRPGTNSTNSLTRSIAAVDVLPVVMAGVPPVMSE